MKQTFKFLIHNWVSGEDIEFIVAANNSKEAWELAEQRALEEEPSNCMRNVQVMGLIH